MPVVETYPTLRDAAQAMGGDGRFLGGGTILMRRVNYDDGSVARILRVARPERGVTRDADGLRIGAATTMADLLSSPEAAFLHPVAAKVGGPAVRNMATVGGNLFASNPYGDMATALLALDAEARMADGQSLPVERLLAERGRLGGLVSAITLRRPASGAFRFRKVSRVKPKGVSVLCIAARLEGRETRVAFGNMAPAPARSRGAEAALAGGVTAAAIDAACAACLDGLSPADDALATAWYRREVAPVHLRRLLDTGGRP